MAILKSRYIRLSVLFLVLAWACKEKPEPKSDAILVGLDPSQVRYDTVVTEFADVKILRYQIPGFDSLSLKKKKLVYYLSQAGLAGRDIIWDQNYRYNLEIRDALEHIYTHFLGDKSTPEWKAFDTYLNRVWFSNGIHHHYSTIKIKPGFTQNYFNRLLSDTKTELDTAVVAILFNDVDNKKVNLSKDADIVLESAVNFYGPEVTQKEVEDFYGAMEVDKEKPIEKGLNSKLVKENGQLVEKAYKVGGLYGNAIQEVIKWLEKAKGVAETEQQAKTLGLLIEYYKTGDLHTWDEYAISWVNSIEGDIDWINGFIEVYNDPKGYKGSYEGIVQIKDFEMSKQMEVLSENAQWFEDNSPLMEAHKKKNVVGVSYKTVNVASEAGDASPSTPIGVNLPNNNWIRQMHGSKSVSLGNIIDAYNRVGSTGRLEEFANDKEEIRLENKYGQKADKLHTALHEVIGHASGQINPGIGTPKETLKSYKSTIEEGRADLVGLYYLYSPKLQELGLVDDWKSVGKAAYDGYIRNGLMTQLIRLNLGDDVEEAHMRNRQWVSAWAFEQGKRNNVIEKITRNGKTYYNITDYEKLREIFGQLLRETQRITSEGDYWAAKNLVENYGVKVDQDIHREVLQRNSRFKSPPYSGFVNPILVPKTDDNGEMIDIVIRQPRTFEQQMLDYSEQYDNL